MRIIIDGVEHVNPTELTVRCDPAGEDVPPFTVRFTGGVCRLERLTVTGDENSPTTFLSIGGGLPTDVTPPVEIG
jgi:hypothetical protein